MVKRLMRKRRAERTTRDRDTDLNINRSGRNEELAAFFDTLSSLFKECPLDRLDDWRSYSYNIVAGRLRYLDYEVTTDPHVLKRLAKVRGFGNKTMKQVRVKECIHAISNHPT